MKKLQFEDKKKFKYILSRGKGILMKDFGVPITFKTKQGAERYLKREKLKGRFVVKKMLFIERIIKK